MKVGILSFAHGHAHSYAKSVLALSTRGVQLVAIADDDVARGKAAANQYSCGFYRDYQELLKTDVEAVIVCSENARHAEMVVAAAEAGKHVLCEKPIATTQKDALRMIRACKENGVILQIAFPVRFSRPIARLKEMVDERKLGRIVAVRGTNRGQNPGGWFIDNALSGGGAVMDHTVHVIDVMRWILKSEVREVYAEVDTHFTSIPTDDCGQLVLEFENGVFASHDPSWSRPASYPTWGDVTLEVVGTSGVTNVNAFAQHFDYFGQGPRPYSHQFWGDDMDYLLIRNFVDVVEGKSAPLITGVDGLRALEVALAAYESGRTHKPVPVHRAVLE